MSRGYFQHGGITFPGILYSPRGLEAARDFPVEDDDVFNVTYQKSGRGSGCGPWGPPKG
uniref:Uncharacterized protein n=1 Tax=Accipiter nisus TaxID=211598 RepID=A0A8B9MHV5_9AVES